MHVHWLSPLSLIDPSHVYQANLASLRLRAGALVSMADAQLSTSIGEHIPTNTDVCVVGKIGVADPYSKQPDWLKIINEFDRPVVLDYTDDHVHKQTVMGSFYRSVLQRVDHVVCSSQQLQESISAVFSKQTSVIADAVEYAPQPPKNLVSQPRRLLWFGHHSNIGALQHFLSTFDPPTAVEILVLSTEQGRQMLQTGQVSQRASVRLLFKLWSIDEMPKAAKLCDACIIPIDEGTKKGASSNRLLTALTLGLPTCADLIPSYLEFQNYLTDLRSQQFEQVIMNPQGQHGTIELAQQYISLHYSFQSLGRKWQATLKGLSTS
jgi:hypothetical protein